MPDPTYSRVGPVSQADGTNPAVRSNKQGAGVVTQAGGKYAEAVGRGNCYAAQTAATGVAPGTALGTTGAFTLGNPKGSGKRLHVMKLGMGYVSGTLGAGVVHIASQADATATAPTGTAITPRNLNVGAANNAVGLPLTTSTIPTTAASMIGILCSLTAALATTAVQPYTVEKDVDGEIIIEPGCSITLHATAAAGTSPLVTFNATWEEITIV